MAPSFTIKALAASLLVANAHAGYTLDASFQGTSFFDDMTFFTAADPTNGFVSYVDKDTALSNLYIGLSDQAPSNGSVYIGVDHTSVVPQTGAGRQAVRVSSNPTWTHGLMTVDVYHMPTGCGLWPAIWFVAPNGTYPGNTGEIDLIEGVHNMTQNAMTLHTDDGCSVQNTTSAFAGTLETSNCYVDAQGQSENSGCSISSHTSITAGQNTRALFGTAGDSFNDNYGGMYTLVWTSTDIEVYFFPRSQIPAELQPSSSSNSSGPDPTAWASQGFTPVAHFTGCDFDQHLSNLALTINTDFCGGWAGGTWESSGCAASTGVSTCNAYVAQTPTAFSNAYWLIGGVNVWQET